MAERLRLNKVSLREQKQKLALYRRFLPALEARKQQFLMQLELVRKEIAQKEAELEKLKQSITTWSGLLAGLEAMIRPFLEIKQLNTSERNVAGLKIKRLQDVVFHNPDYSFFATPYSFETVLTQLRQAIAVMTEIKLLKEQEALLYEGFRKTSQRINLYEQRLIPGCREAIKKISVYLQDQQAAAVGVAKTAKRMLENAAQASGG